MWIVFFSLVQMQISESRTGPSVAVFQLINLPGKKAFLETKVTGPTEGWGKG